jgi:hypothetical protein
MAEREAERAAEKEQWAAQLLQEVDTARVEAEGEIEQAQAQFMFQIFLFCFFQDFKTFLELTSRVFSLSQMSFDLIVESLRAESGAEKRVVAANEVAHSVAMQKQEV